MKKLITAALCLMLALACVCIASADTQTLQAPSDFKFDPSTGAYSFMANDENMGYYFIRFYEVENGQITGEYISSSKRIRGGKTGEISGTIDLSDVAWGEFAVSLCSFAPAGTDYVTPDPINIMCQFGVDLPLERPEMLAMYSGNTVQLVVDWWTLCDYRYNEYLPMMKFTFYADAECTNEVLSDTVDLKDLAATMSKNPPGIIIIWGYHAEAAKTADDLFLYTADGYDASASSSNANPFAGGGTLNPLYFIYDNYQYTLPAGTYYVTCQAISRDAYVKDSQVSTVLEITLTDDEPTSEFSQAKTELWTDPQQMDMPGANPGQQADRVDCCLNQPVSGALAD